MKGGVCEGSRPCLAWGSSISHSDKMITLQTKLEPLMTKRSLGTCPPSPPIPLEIGKDIEFPISGRMGFQAISVEPYWTWWPLQISGFHPLTVSHLQRHFSLCFAGRLCYRGKAFLFAESHRQVSQLLEEEVELDWPGAEPPESDSGLASHGFRAYFLFTRGLIMVSKLVCQDASRTG